MRNNTTMLDVITSYSSLLTNWSLISLFKTEEIRLHDCQRQHTLNASSVLSPRKVMVLLLLTLLKLFVTLPLLVSGLKKQPHVVLMIADDLGWNDVSWHNPTVKMPHLHKLATSGVIFNRSYVQPSCSPSRASILTGQFAHKTGLQHGPLGDLQPSGLPTHLKILPQRLKTVGYKTHLVGKWHLGFCKKEYLPNHRGFDSFYGYVSGLETYTTHESYQVTNKSVRGVDFRSQDNIVYNQNGTYSTYSYANRVGKILEQHDKKSPLFLMYAFQSVHMPLEVPRRFYNMFPHEKDYKRRIYLGMIAAMDEAVGRLIRDLKTHNMYYNTIFAFLSDNGGKRPHSGASNYPFRGYKDSLWEGAVRSPTFVSGKQLTDLKGNVVNDLVHASDWKPTILDLAGYNIKKLKVSGYSHAKTILKGKKGAKRHVVVNIDEREGTAAIIQYPYKLIVGSPEYCRAWYHYPYNMCKQRIKSFRAKGRWLYHILTDPTEKHNIASKHPKVVKNLISHLHDHFKEIIPSVERPNSLKGLPKNGAWTTGWC